VSPCRPGELNARLASCRGCCIAAKNVALLRHSLLNRPSGMGVSRRRRVGGSRTPARSSWLGSLCAALSIRLKGVHLVVFF
jgi:hypothetical protein